MKKQGVQECVDIVALKIKEEKLKLKQCESYYRHSYTVYSLALVNEQEAVIRALVSVKEALETHYKGLEAVPQTQ